MNSSNEDRYENELQQKIIEANAVHKMLDTDGWQVVQDRMKLYHFHCLEELKDKSNTLSPETLDYRRRLVNKVEEWMSLPYTIIQEVEEMRMQYEKILTPVKKPVRTTDIDK